MSQTYRDVRPCNREPITGQPLFCSECGGDLNSKGHCVEWWQEDAPSCQKGNNHLDYNWRELRERILATCTRIDAIVERM